MWLGWNTILIVLLLIVIIDRGQLVLLTRDVGQTNSDLRQVVNACATNATFFIRTQRILGLSDSCRFSHVTLQLVFSAPRGLAVTVSPLTIEHLRARDSLEIPIRDMTAIR